jgi:hypothetical protein
VATALRVAPFAARGSSLFAAAFALSLQRAARELIFQNLSTLVTKATVSES